MCELATGTRSWARHDDVIAVETSIGGGNMQKTMKILKITNALHGNCAGFGLMIG